MCNEQSNIPPLCGEGILQAAEEWAHPMTIIEPLTSEPPPSPIQDRIEDDIEMYIEAMHRCLVKYGYADLVGRFNDVVVLYVQIRAEREAE